ncbi:putative protein kinase RLK-Pelle-CrRLK1L-1 family [Helianthus annuus]|nr:putative protein kinase RLK-Pelle-CrRLK1L-1 family [Helianthus annuus]
MKSLELYFDTVGGENQTLIMSVPTSSSSESPQLCRQFTFSEIQLATQNLDDSLVVGRGGFGKVYKGTITNGPHISIVAIKRLDSTSNQGASEFWAEVNMLSNLRHCHLVRQTPLSWVRRLKICIGAARGLNYLHTGTGIEHGVVHRDVKSSNILLHDSWEAKISDFGLSKMCPKNRQTTYVNTGVKGTFGYLDPDYFYTDSRINVEHWGLAIWAQESIKEGRLKHIVDTNIREEISPKCLKVFAQLAKQCLHMRLKQRPTMAAIVAALESILALQEKANNTLQPKVISASPKVERRIRFVFNDENLGIIFSSSFICLVYVLIVSNTHILVFAVVLFNCQPLSTCYFWISF